MRKVGLLLALGLGMMLSGCIAGSLRPLYTDKDVTFDPGLLGKWQVAEEEPDSGLWTFAKTEDGGHSLTIETKTDEGKTERGQWEAHVVSLGMYTFLDLYPAPDEAVKEVVDEYGYLGLHSQYLLRRDQDTVRLAILDWDWLEAQLKQGKVHVGLADLGNDTSVLTGSPPELQQFYANAVRDSEAFPELIELKRVPPGDVKPGK